MVFDCLGFFFKRQLLYTIHESLLVSAKTTCGAKFLKKIRDSGELKQKVLVENWTSNLMHQNVKAYFKMLMEDSRRMTVLKVSDDAVVSNNSEAGTLEGFPGSGYW